MDKRNGKIYSPEELDKLRETDPEIEQFIQEMTIHPSRKQLNKKRVHFKDPCPCGSGKVFKNCCLFAPKKSKP